MFVLELPIKEEQLAALEGEGDFSYLVALPIGGAQTVVQIHIRRRKFFDAMYAAVLGGNLAGIGSGAPLAGRARLVQRSE